MALFITFVTGYIILLANLVYNSCMTIDAQLILQAITPVGAVVWYAYQGASDQVGLRFLDVSHQIRYSSNQPDQAPFNQMLVQRLAKTLEDKMCIWSFSTDPRNRTIKMNK